MKDALFKAIRQITVCAGLILLANSAAAVPLNEWTFESDPAGRTLSQTANIGIEGVAFGSGGAGFLETDGAGELVCTHDDPGTGGMWTNGAVLNAAVSAATSGVYYLRYDLEYSLTNELNDSGAVLGAYFTDSTGGVAAGLVLTYDTGTASTPTNLTLDMIDPGVALSGTLTAIAEVNLSAHMLRVWYSLNSEASFDINFPAAATNITLATIDNLHFHATGDFRPAGTADFADIKNIRMADSWADITAPVPDFSGGPAVEISSVSVTDAGGAAGIGIGETNTVEVVIHNAGAPVSNLTSALTAVLHPEYFLIISNNAPATLGYPAYQLTNTFRLVALPGTVPGIYPFTAAVTADGGISTNSSFSLAVGAQLSYLTSRITEFSPGLFPGRYEPGDALDIMVISTNDSARTVTNAENRLYADPAYFTVTPSSDLYSSVNVGASTSSTYRVAISPNVPAGTHTFYVTNSTAAAHWDGSFTVNIFRESRPAVNPPSVNLEVVKGSSGSATVVITNSGNIPVHFSISDNSTPEVSYAVQTNAGAEWVSSGLSPITLNPPVYGTAADKGVSAAIPAGFEFPFFGQNYSHFFVNADGAVGLSRGSATNAGSGAYVSLPSGDVPLIAPFWGDLISPAGSITYRLLSDRLLISYSGVSQQPSGLGGTNLQFQVSLYKTGRIGISYRQLNGSWLSHVAVGVQRDFASGIDLATPASGTTVMLTPQVSAWIGYTSASGVVGPLGSQTITITADAARRTAGVYPVTATFGWDNGTQTNLPLTITVLGEDPVRNEWTFENDAAGLSPSQTQNSGGEGIALPSGGTGYLLTDGVGGLLCTDSTQISSGSGYLAYPSIADITAGRVYLRFDMTYKLDSPLSTIGMQMVFGCRDALKNGSTQDFLRFNRFANAVQSTLYYIADNTGVLLNGSLPLAGTLSGIMRIDLDTHTMDVWYDKSGSNQFTEASPAKANIPISITDVGSLYFVLTGVCRPAGSDNYVVIDNLRMATTWNTAAAAPVHASRPVYNGPSAVSFSGRAGEISTTAFTISNSGSADLNFTISNTNAAAAGYTLDASAPYSWMDTSAGTPVSFSDPDPNPFITAADEGYSGLIPFGFNFPFYGGSYTQICVSVNGAIRLGDNGRIRALGNLGSTASDMPEQLIAPYWGDLVFPNGGSVRYLSSSNRLTVTWAGMRQYGLNGGSNLTFQAELESSGAITFRYQYLEGYPWPHTAAGLRSTTEHTVSASPVCAGDFTLMTNGISGVVYTQYVNSVSQRAVRFAPAGIQVISCSPGNGTVPPGGSLPVTVYGNATGISSGSATITNRAVLAVSHNGWFEPATVAVSFIATGSAPASEIPLASAALLDSDRDGMNDDAERIAGSDPQNSFSVFSISASGTRELNWNGATGRTYTVWWTDNLTKPFEVLAAGLSGGQYVDTQHAGVPVIYYRVTVE